MGGEAGEAKGPAAAPPEADRVDALAAHLGIAFQDRVRALSALTHKSYVNEHRDEGGEDNERLEFLGDAVVDLLVSQRLMERFPRAREGELSKMRAAVVDEAGLASMARSLGLGALLRLGRGEELTGGRDKPSLLADAMEAVIAAVFLERGLSGVHALVDRSLEEAYARAAAGTLDRDYKTQMQEICQGRFRLSPRYRVVAEHGPDHHKTFEVAVEVRGEVMGIGTGRSKKDAEQLAARQALDALQSAGSGGEVPPPSPAAEPPPEPPAAPAPAPAPENAGEALEEAPRRRLRRAAPSRKVAKRAKAPARRKTARPKTAKGRPRRAPRTTRRR